MEKREWPSWYTHSEKVELAKNGIYFDLDSEEDFPELKEYFEQKDAKAKKGKKKKRWPLNNCLLLIMYIIH